MKRGKGMLQICFGNIIFDTHRIFQMVQYSTNNSQKRSLSAPSSNYSENNNCQCFELAETNDVHRGTVVFPGFGTVISSAPTPTSFPKHRKQQLAGKMLGPIIGISHPSLEKSARSVLSPPELGHRDLFLHRCSWRRLQPSQCRGGASCRRS